MSEQMILGLDELSSLLKGDVLIMDEKDHEVVDNSDDTVTIILDPESSTIVEGTGEMVGDSLSEDIYIRLGSFGYTNIDEVDKTILRLLLEKVKESVRNFINNDKIPEGLHFKIVDAVCAEFLQTKYTMGKVNLEVSSPVASIKEGDTTVTYGVNSTAVSPQKIFLTALENMQLSKSEMCRYRRFVW